MRCPVCRATVDTGPQCRRCRADLSLLFALESQRQSSLRDACRALAGGDVAQMVADMERAHALRRDEITYRLLALGNLLRRDFAAAWQNYRLRLSADNC